MKKHMSALAFAGALTFAGLMPSAEALVPYQGPDGNCLVFADSLSADSGYVMKSYPNLCYVGKWQRHTNGKISILFDKEYVKDDTGKIIGNSKVNLPFFVSKNKNDLQVSTSENSSDTPQSFFRAEYAWGNDKLMASYMLVDYLKSQGPFSGKVAIVGSRTNTLDSEMQAMVLRNAQNANGEGHWLKVTSNDSVKYYYVESDPRIIYEQIGSSLNMLVRDEQLTFVNPTTEACPLGNNRARVVMHKDNTTEYYQIFFAPSYFVVEKATADNPNVAAELQNEIGVQQSYGPNPRVNLVKETFSCDK